MPRPRVVSPHTLLAFLLCLCTAMAALAQNERVTYSESTVLNPDSFTDGFSIAIDPAGNLFVADWYARALYKETLQSDGTYTKSTIPNSASQPWAVAIGSDGSLYVSDPAGKVFKETPSGSSYSESTVVAGLNTVLGTTVDAAGNVYVVESGAGRILKESPAGGGSYAQSIIATGLNGPQGGIVVDSTGNVFVADSGNHRTLKLTLAGGTYTQSTVLDGSDVNGIPQGVALDPMGNIFVSYNGGFGANAFGIYEAMPTGGGNYNKFQAAFDGGYGLISAGTTIYFATGTGIQKITPNMLARDAGAIGFASLPIGTAAPSQIATFTFLVQSTLAATPYGVSTQGDLQSDFRGASSQAADVCTGGKTYNVGDTCTVAVTFTPSRPGVRYGAAVLFQPNGAPIATTYLQGGGVGPQVSFTPGTTSSRFDSAGINLASPYLTSNADGAVLFDDDGDRTFYNPNTATRTYAAISLSIMTGYTDPVASDPAVQAPSTFGIAIDGAGNIIQLDSQDSLTSMPGPGNTIVHSMIFNPTLPYISGTLPIDTRYGKAFIASVPESLGYNYPTLSRPATDGKGNVYFFDPGAHRLLKETWINGNYNQQTVIDDNFTVGGDVVVDAAGDVFILDITNNRVVKETPSGSTYTAAPVVTGLVNPLALGIDKLGNLYITLPPTGPINPQSILKETLLPGGTYQASMTSALGDAGVDVDPASNIFFTVRGNIYRQDLADPPSLKFASTAIGATSTDSPQTVTLFNSGNDALTFSVPTMGVNPLITTGYNIDPSSTCPVLNTTATATPLAPGASCTLKVNFVPTVSGDQPGTLTLTDNHLNTPGSQQVIKLDGTGTGTATTAPLAALTPASADYGTVTIGVTAPAKTFILANAGTAALPITSTTITGSNAANFVIVSNNCGTSLAAGTSCTIGVTFTATVSGAATATLNVSDSIGTQTATLTANATTAVVTAPQAALTPASSDFGSINIGSTTAGKVFTLANAGNAALPITSIGLTGTSAAAFTITANTCGISLAAGASCDITVAFKAATAGAAAATLAVVDSIGTQAATLTGTGITTTGTPDFTVAATPSTQSTYRGTSVTYSVQVASANNALPFTTAVTLTAAGFPNGATASFSPAAVTPGTSIATSTMTVTVPALTSTNEAPNMRPIVAALSAASFLCLFSLTGTRLRRTVRLLALALFSLAASTAMLTGCGSGTGFLVPTSTSTITVTGTSGTTVHSTTVTLTIQ